LEKIARLLNKKAPTIKASPIILGIAWRLAKIKSLFGGSKPALTKESAQAASSKLEYNNEKLLKTIDFSFKPVEQTLQEIAHTYSNNIINN
jgi:hypothetical protein